MHATTLAYIPKHQENTGYVAFWVMVHSFEVFGNTTSYFVTKRSAEQHFMTLSLP